MSHQLNRRGFIKTIGYGATALSLSVLEFCGNPDLGKPNVIFILADDLGYGELGCYGQGKIKTPNIDKLAAAGMRFTQHYSGSPVCAPSRCTLLTGKHTGHAYIRDNDEMSERGDVWRNPDLEGQRPLEPNTFTLGTMFQQAGYITGAIGKWGLGGPGSTGEPNKQGFDFWYGYLCQRVAHNYYPTHLWKNVKKHMLGGNPYFFPHQKLPEDKDPLDKTSYHPYSGQQYSMDLMFEETYKFIKDNHKKPFFLYLPYPVPHVSLQVPKDSLKEYENTFEEKPYLGERGYVPHAQPRAAYAAMITRMDRGIGKILALLKKLGIKDNTLVLFTSDNGPTYAGGVDYDFFNSAGLLRDLKGSVYEGGIRVPMIASWPGKIKPGTVCDHVSAFWDYLPTFAEITGTRLIEEKTDGISILPVLTGNPEKQKKHKYLYWEHQQKKQAVRMGKWKAVRLTPQSEIELYNLEADIGEGNNIAEDFPGIVAKMDEIMTSGRTPSKLFPLKIKE